MHRGVQVWGSTFTCRSGFNFRIGVWGSEEDPESSNWKEFTNVVESLEDEAKVGNLEGSEVNMFTDNSTVKSCASRGTSSSPKLLNLMICFQGLMTTCNVKIHIFHVAGTRMIAQGTNGVSRGYLGQGVMAGESMVAHIPIYLSSITRAPDLVPWIRSWCCVDAILLIRQMAGLNQGTASKDGLWQVTVSSAPAGCPRLCEPICEPHLRFQPRLHWLN